MGKGGDLPSLNTEAPSPSLPGENVGGGFLCIRGFLLVGIFSNQDAATAAGADFSLDFLVILNFKEGL